MKRSVFMLFVIMGLSHFLSAQEGDFILSAKKDWCYKLELLDLSLNIPPEWEDSLASVELEISEGDVHLFDQYGNKSFGYNVVTEESTPVHEEIFRIIPLELGPVSLRGKVVLGDGTIHYSNPLDFSLLPHPKGESDLFVNIHSFADQWRAGEAGHVLVEVFSFEAFGGALPYPAAREGMRLNTSEPLEEETVYLLGTYHRMKSFPLRVFFEEPGEYALYPEFLELSFRSEEDGKPHSVAVPVVQSPLVVTAAEGAPEENPLTILSCEAVPDIWSRGNEVELIVTMKSEGDLSGLDSLLPYGEYPDFLEETAYPARFEWVNDKLWETRRFSYRGIVSRRTGVNLGTLAIPGDLVGGGEDSFVLDMGRQPGDYHPAAVIVFFSVMILTAAALVFFVVYTIGRSRKRGSEREEKKDLQDIYLFSDEFRLTNRERDVLKILVEGKSTKEIADELYISPDTAKKHINNILNKTETHSRLEILVLLDKYMKKETPAESENQKPGSQQQ